jgi:hypothetical protein
MALTVQFLADVISQKPEDEHKFQVGDRVSVTLHTGLIVDRTVRAIVERADGARLQVDYRNDETAMVEQWRMRAK